ncbi:DsbA family oxidoreductase [Chelativorans sp. AA-79]|uniref:DsbA family oxidoreductase n=1 Tax=Chelativorans sp. AA-79 TaxID=3028735 RepID=UPI0023F8F5E3|nr:DsbA family oxidoreductase [Chelativorans sp. AA-79]WEX07091.1 DsbA family oxidoreductase [Chelativorans sp. AA-79]
MTEKANLSVDVVSDVVCPWCFLGMRNLQAAMANVDDIDVTVRWRPYQLDPAIPRGGLDRQDYMLKKFGSLERLEAAHDRLREMGAAVGISYDFEAIKVAPNTLDAHRVIRWAATAGQTVQNILVERLFRLYFEEGRNIGDHAVLIDAARDAGMDASLVETLLPSPADGDEVATEIETARRMGVTGVPCFLLEGRYALMGAQPPEALADAIAKVSEAKEKGELDKEQG